MCNSEKSESVDSKYFNFAARDLNIQKSEEHSKKENCLINEFLRNKDVAPWFRGTSIFHMQGTNELFNAIRDDTEQRTSHRVKRCLYMIGLGPIPPAKDLKLLMHLSRGNDLAFLWFLMEMHYKNSNSKSYTLNEQLICSAICHLDMVTTLRELDKILPNSSESESVVPESRESLPDAKTRRIGSIYTTPYFEKIPRPQPYGKTLTVNMPDFKVKFKTYADYADPDYIVHNECNRWFADYDFNPGRRVAYTVIRTAIDNIFENFEAAQLKAKSIKALCAYHRVLQELEESHKHQLTLNFRDKCLKRNFGDTTIADNKRHRLVNDTLHKAIEQQLCEFRRQTLQVRRKVTLRTISSDCDIVEVIVGESDEKCSGKSTTSRYAGECFEQYSKKSREFVKHLPSKTILDNLKLTKLNSAQIALLLEGKSPSQISIFATKYIQSYDFGHAADTSLGTSKTFFRAPTLHTPHQFDYRQIFQCRGGKDNDEKWRIKKAFLNALDRDISTLNELQDAESKLVITARECASKMWKGQLRNCGGRRCDFNTSKSDSEWPLQQYPKRDSYNAEDRTLMDKMLADAFEYMRKNSNFVLAHLPEAHKLPMLREWISRRFGKVYSPKDRILSYRYSLKVFHALDRMSFDFTTPTAAQLCSNQFASYDCKKYLIKKVKYIKDRFYRRMDNAIMKQCRTYWFAMRGYLCSGSGPPRQTFFAYMPSRLRDIQRFRLWRFSEHRPDKAAWDKRRLLSKNRQ